MTRFVFRHVCRLVLVCSSCVAIACGATLLPGNYALQIWQSDDGLPENAVSAAVQTKDGYMWIATYGGLVRFDGERFQVFNSNNTPALGDSRILSLFEDAHGTLWIGHETGLITEYRDGKFASFAAPSQHGTEKVVGIGRAEDGRLWALRQSGILQALDDGTLTNGERASLPDVLAMTRNARGQIWVGRDGHAMRLNGNHLDEIAFEPAKITDWVVGLAAAEDGGLWVLRDTRIRKLIHGQWQDDRGVYPWNRAYVTCCLELRDGTLAVGTVDDGLYLVFHDGHSVHIDRANGLPQNWVRFLYQDREGDVWFGCGSAGLASIHPTAFSALSPPDAWQGRSVLSVAPGHDGGLWVGTEGAGLYHFASGRWSHYGEAEGLANPFIWAVTEDSDHQVWTGNWVGGPYLLKNGRFDRLEKMDTASGPVAALYVNKQDRELLIGNRDGLLQYIGGNAWWLYKSPDVTPTNVCAVLRDRQGALWFGLSNGGLVRSYKGTLSTFTKKDGLPSNAIQCLFCDDNNALWIGTAESGLVRGQGEKFATIDTRRGLTDDVVCHVEDDGLGYLWITTHNGIQRVAKEELNRCANGQLSAITGQVYNRFDGLPTGEYSGRLQAAGCKTEEGKLWFTSSKGLFAVDPSRIQPNAIIPPVILDSILIDGKSIAVTGSALEKPLPPEHERLAFQFTALSFVAPGKVFFKYQLEGVDKNWIETSNGRIAYYSHLPPGTYRFRVIACNNDGVWNTEGASLAFKVAPFFWQTWFFIGACAVLILASVAWAVRSFTHRRIGARMAELERQHAIDRERARIARDIHDDLGGNLTQIAMLSQPSPRSSEELGKTANMLSGIYAAARQGIRALDEIVWAVDPQQDTLDSLVSYMGEYAQDFLESAQIKCRLDFPADLPPWPLRAETRHHLFLAFKEVLNNTLKHASATEVSVVLRLEQQAFVLVVKDNGRGFDHAKRRNGASSRTAGNGLFNLEQRLARIGGRCEISAVNTEGTRVAFFVGVTPMDSDARTIADSLLKN